jgi:hypothetical protein
MNQEQLNKLAKTVIENIEKITGEEYGDPPRMLVVNEDEFLEEIIKDDSRDIFKDKKIARAFFLKDYHNLAGVYLFNTRTYLTPEKRIDYLDENYDNCKGKFTINHEFIHGLQGNLGYKQDTKHGLFKYEVEQVKIEGHADYLAIKALMFDENNRKVAKAFLDVRWMFGKVLIGPAKRKLKSTKEGEYKALNSLQHGLLGYKYMEQALKQGLNHKEALFLPENKAYEIMMSVK